MQKKKCNGSYVKIINLTPVWVYVANIKEWELDGKQVIQEKKGQLNHDTVMFKF